MAISLRLASALAGLLGCLGVLASPAAAACSAPVTSGTTTTVTCTAGTGQTVNVPDHVGGVTIAAWGGQGGLSGGLSPYYGGPGGVQGIYTKSGPFVLSVDVATAGAGAASGGAGGVPGGGAGASGGGGGGGGYSDILDGTTTLIVGGGGGGVGSSSQFGGGGSGGGGYSSFLPNGQPGGICNSPGNCFPAGYGGTQSAPGAGESETVAGDITGNSGSGSAGGAGGATTGGGGGGGGYFGGGGGGTAQSGAGGGGGGGGSTFSDASLTSVAYPLSPGGDGSVTVSYTTPAAPAITSAAHASFTVGTAATYTITSTGRPTPTISLDDPTDVPAGLKFTAGAAGTGSGTISGTPTGDPGTVTLTVRAHSGVGADATQHLVVDVAKPPGTVSVGGGYVSLGGGSSGSASPVAPTSNGVGVSLGCAGATGKTCTGQVAVSVRERRLGTKIVAVLAGTKTKTVSVVVGKAKYSIKAGQIKVIKVTLNAAGRALLKRFHRLTVKVTVSVSTTNGLHQAATRTVTIKAPKKHKHK